MNTLDKKLLNLLLLLLCVPARSGLYGLWRLRHLHICHTFNKLYPLVAIIRKLLEALQLCVMVLRCDVRLNWLVMSRGQFKVVVDSERQRVARPAEVAAGRIVEVVEHGFLRWCVIGHSECVTEHAPGGAADVRLVEFGVGDPASVFDAEDSS